MDTELALLVVQLKVALCPWTMEEGEALNSIAGFLGLTVILTLAVR
jgi:hypothetical protein